MEIIVASCSTRTARFRAFLAGMTLMVAIEMLRLATRMLPRNHPARVYLNARGETFDTVLNAVMPSDWALNASRLTMSGGAAVVLELSFGIVS